MMRDLLFLAVWTVLIVGFGACLWAASRRQS
jgi:hypothetical protein